MSRKIHGRYAEKDRKFDLLAFSDETSIGLGISVRQTQFAVMAAEDSNEIIIADEEDAANDSSVDNAIENEIEIIEELINEWEQMVIPTM